MAPISNRTHITSKNVSGLTDEEIKVVLEESKRRQSETATTLDHKETTSKAPKWTGKLYYDPEAPADNETGKQPTLNREYDGATLTYVRLDGIEKAFQKQGIEVKNFDSRKEATPYLKEIFRDYETKFPELWEKDNWFNPDPSILYKTLLGPNGALRNTPYAGFQGSTVKRRRSGNGSCLWLPLRLRGRFVSLWSDRNFQEANFAHGVEEDAILVAGFED